MQYIDKSTVAAEIEKKLQDIICCKRDAALSTERVISLAKIDMCKEIISFLDTLEMKEVDIEDAVHATIDYPLIGCDFPNIYPNYKELKEYCDMKGIKDNDKIKLIIIKDI